jgi:hypothetical protein
MRVRITLSLLTSVRKARRICPKKDQKIFSFDQNGENLKKILEIVPLFKIHVLFLRPENYFFMGKTISLHQAQSVSRLESTLISANRLMHSDLHPPPIIA